MDNAGSLFEGKRGPKPTNEQSNPDRLYAKIGQLNGCIFMEKIDPFM